MRPVRNRLVLLIALCLLCCCIPFSKSFAATIDGVTYTVNYGRLAKVSGGTPGFSSFVFSIKRTIGLKQRMDNPVSTRSRAMQTGIYAQSIRNILCHQFVLLL